MNHVPHRRYTETENIGPGNRFAVSVSFTPDGHPFEIFVTKRGRSGTELDDILYDLGVRASKMMQRKP